MRRWVLSIFGVVAAIATVLALAMWLGSYSAENEIKRLTAEGKRAGLFFDPPKRERHARAEQLRRRLDKLGDVQKPYERELLYVDTEVTADLRRIVRETADIYKLAVELSDQPSMGYLGERDVYIGVLTATEAIEARARLAIQERHVEEFLKDAERIRRFIGMLPENDDIGSLVNALLTHMYCLLIQYSAEVLSNDAHALGRIAAEVGKLHEPNYKESVRYWISTAIESIDYDYNRNNLTPLETLQSWLNNDKSERARQKVAAIKAAIWACRNWDKDLAVAKLAEGNDYHEGSFLGAIKQEELRATNYLRAVRLTVRAHRHRAETGEWPTLEALRKSGLETADPIGLKPYRWKTVDGKTRVVGSTFQGRNKVKEAVLLVTSYENERMNPRQ
jgi:hypothetical protein